MAILKKLDIFWGKAQCNRSWKLRVFNAVITSKVLYGLETLEPTESAGRLLNTFQLKGLRKILKLHTTYIQRHNTNEYVYRRANETLNAPTTGFDRKIKPLTEILEERNSNYSDTSSGETETTLFTKQLFQQHPLSREKLKCEESEDPDSFGPVTICKKHGK